jgi:hypothetical protein
MVWRPSWILEGASRTNFFSSDPNYLNQKMSLLSIYERKVFLLQTSPYYYIIIRWKKMFFSFRFVYEYFPFFPVFRFVSDFFSFFPFRFVIQTAFFPRMIHYPGVLQDCYRLEASVNCNAISQPSPFNSVWLQRELQRNQMYIG